MVRVLFTALAAALLYWTWRRTDATLVQSLHQCAMPSMLAATALYGLAQLLGAWRWRTLMAVQQMRLGLWTALKLTLVGNFFSLLIPGAVTGDLVKIACTARDFPVRAPQITLVIMLDRVIGLCGIFFAAAIATILCLPGLLTALDDRSAWPLTLSLLVVNAGCLATVTAYGLFRLLPRCRICTAFFRRMLEKLPASLSNPVGHMLQALALYRGNGRILLRTLLLSICIHLTAAGTVFCIGRSLGEVSMSLPQYTLVTQLSNVTGLIPATPGGIGLRDAVSARLLQFFQASPLRVCGVIPLVNSLVIIFWGLAGALCYAFTPTLNAPRQPSGAPSP